MMDLKTVKPILTVNTKHCLPRVEIGTCENSAKFSCSGMFFYYLSNKEHLIQVSRTLKLFDPTEEQV